VDETPVVEVPVDETPVIEVPVDEPPVVKEPVDDTPVVEVPVDEPPVTGSPQYPDAVTAPVTWRSMVSDVLRWVGLPALSESSWIPAVVVPWPLNQLWMGLRRIEYHLFNDRPQVRPQQLSRDAVTGAVIGALNGTDGDGDKITYTLVDLPATGHVELLADGTYRYTPTAEFAHAGGSDKFTVRIEDKVGNPWHAHGLAGWFGLSRPKTVTVTVSLNPATNGALSIPAPIGAGSSGVVSGALLGLDPTVTQSTTP
jgi:hypothetical protein